LAKARAAASPTVPAVRVDDNSPARAFVDELRPEAAPPRADGRVMMIAGPSQRGDVARPPSFPVAPPIMTSTSATDWAEARALAQRGRKRTIVGAVLLGVGGGVFVVGFVVLLSYLAAELRDFPAPPDNPDNAGAWAGLGVTLTGLAILFSGVPPMVLGRRDVRRARNRLRGISFAPSLSRVGASLSLSF
jgi:hypothetical protein